MRPRLGTLVLLALLAIFQMQLWFGRGSLSQVHQLRQDLSAQTQRNESTELVNRQLEADIGDLKEGLQMVEEKARMELGMVKQNEIFVQTQRKDLQ